jgi:hypothetical protein
MADCLVRLGLALTVIVLITASLYQFARSAEPVTVTQTDQVR